jgi:DNA primase large subunit
MRKPVLELIERAKKGIHLTHHQRLAIAFEMITNGYSDDEIVEIFRNQDDFDENKTRGQLKQIREKGYRPYTTENLLQILQEVDEE